MWNWISIKQRLIISVDFVSRVLNPLYKLSNAANLEANEINCLTIFYSYDFCSLHDETKALDHGIMGVFTSSFHLCENRSVGGIFVHRPVTNSRGNTFRFGCFRLVQTKQHVTNR